MLRDFFLGGMGGGGGGTFAYSAEGGNKIAIFDRNRNCVMGPNYSVKIGTFGWADRELYANDYCFMGHVATSEEFHDAPDDQASQEEPLPLRWMAWESVAMVKEQLKKKIYHWFHRSEHGQGLNRVHRCY